MQMDASDIECETALDLACRTLAPGGVYHVAGLSCIYVLTRKPRAGDRRTPSPFVVRGGASADRRPGPCAERCPVTPVSALPFLGFPRCVLLA